MAFKVENFRPNIAFEHLTAAYPCRLLCVSSDTAFEDVTNTYYGYVLRGSCTVRRPGSDVSMFEGMYFAVPGGFRLETSGQVVVMQKHGYRALTAFGGPVEEDGRLSYIDNCRATILISPARLGDPVLNHLIFPAGISQTSHVHPSTRLGVVIAGSGTIVTPEGKQSLEVGMVFSLDAFQIHCFHSGSKGLAVVAFHPDSDVGPTDEQHPMKSRTYVLK